MSKKKTSVLDKLNTVKKPRTWVPYTGTWTWLETAEVSDDGKLCRDTLEGWAKYNDGDVRNCSHSPTGPWANTNMVCIGDYFYWFYDTDKDRKDNPLPTRGDIL